MQRSYSLATLLMAATVVAVAKDECKPAPSPCGDKLSHFGTFEVTAFSNGNDQGSGNSCACDGRYQCVEFVKRFYATELGVTRANGWFVGKAIRFWYSATADVKEKDESGKDVVVANNKDLAQFENEKSTVGPEKGDIIVFEGGSFGHVAVVTKVTSTTVSIIEQNWSETGTFDLSVSRSDGKYTISPRDSYEVRGWLRPKNRKATGILEGVSQVSRISGWAKDPDSTSAIVVHLFFDKNAGTSGASPQPVVADQPHSGAGSHGFEWSVPADLRDGREHKVWAWGIDTTDPSNSFQLAGSPKTFKIDPAPTNQPPTGGFLMGAQNKTAIQGGTLNLTVPARGMVSVSFDGSFPTYSKDDGSISRWLWKVNDVVIGTTAKFSADCAVGVHRVSLVVTDNQNLSSTAATATIIVTENRVTSSMNQGRVQHTATLLDNGTVLGAGGGTNAAEIYNPQTNTWRYTQTAAGVQTVMTRPRQWHTAIKLPDGRVLIAGGTESPASAEIFDPVTEQFTATSPMNGPHNSGPIGVLLSDGRPMVIAGSLGFFGPGVSEVYDRAADRWTTTTSIAVGVSQAVGLTLRDGQVLALGGYDGYTRTAYPLVVSYNPANKSTRSMADMLVARLNHTATLLPSGKLLIVGGSDHSYSVSSVEIYDPAAGPNGQSQFANPLQFGRRDHTATALPNGDVLVTGGYQGGHGTGITAYLATMELYSSSTGTWTSATTMTTPRFGHSATLLPNGRVLIVGGLSNISGSPLSSTELY